MIINKECPKCDGDPEHCRNCPFANGMLSGINDLRNIVDKHEHELRLIRELVSHMEEECENFKGINRLDE